MLGIAALAAPGAAQEAEGAETLRPPPERGGPSEPAETPAGAEPAVSDAPTREVPRLLVIDSEIPSAAGLLGMMRIQLPGWRVDAAPAPDGMLAMDRMRHELRRGDAILWLEREATVVQVVVTGRDGSALVSPIPRAGAGEDRSRVYALAAVGLLIELFERRERLAAYEDSVVVNRGRQIDELRERRDRDTRRIEELERSHGELRARLARAGRRRRGRWRNPLPDTGSFFRLGAAQGFSPRHRLGGGVSPWPTGGARLAFGYRFFGRLEVGGSTTTLHARGLWNGSVSAFASIHSQTRVRVGASAEVGILVARESDQGDVAGVETGWTGVRFYLPVELGIVTHRRGGIFLKLGPVITNPPDSYWFIGYDLSMEWEFD